MFGCEGLRGVPELIRMFVGRQFTAVFLLFSWLFASVHVGRHMAATRSDWRFMPCTSGWTITITATSLAMIRFPRMRITTT